MVKDQRSGIICQYKIYVIELGRLNLYHGHQMRQLIRQVLDTLQSHNIHRKMYLIFVDIMDLCLVCICNEMYSVFNDTVYLQPTSYLFQIPPIHLTMLPLKEKRVFIFLYSFGKRNLCLNIYFFNSWNSVGMEWFYQKGEWIRLNCLHKYMRIILWWISK